MLYNTACQFDTIKFDKKEQHSLKNVYKLNDHDIKVC